MATDPHRLICCSCCKLQALFKRRVVRYFLKDAAEGAALLFFLLFSLFFVYGTQQETGGCVFLVCMPFDYLHPCYGRALVPQDAGDAGDPPRSFLLPPSGAQTSGSMVMCYYSAALVTPTPTPPPSPSYTYKHWAACK